jgi:nucleobase:cation symporter-1, NCS1 family
MSHDVADRSEQREAALTLAGPTPKVLGFGDQAAFWANLGVSLLGFSGALAVLAPAGFPQLSIVAALAATVVGTVLGSVMVGLAAVPGSRTGAPSMVLLRGLFGARLSALPTVLNVLQLIGWGTFELLVIAQGAQAVWHGGPRWVYVVATGALTTVLTLRPLGLLRLLRRYATVVVLIAMVYLLVQLLRHPLPPLTTGSWHGFWAGADAALAVAVSWIPVASDYSRHSRRTTAAFSAAVVGFSVTQVFTYALGLLALALVGGAADRAFDPFLAVPLGAVFFAVLVLREADQTFADVYSTAVSVQNLRPRADRRVLSVAAGVLTTLLALTLDISQYTGFLTLIGSVFVPMFGALAADYFLSGRRHRWDLTETAPARWRTLVAWLLGFVTYQLINPGSVGWWSALWSDLQNTLGIEPNGWTSASLFSFAVAALVTHVINLVRPEPASTSDGR